MEQGNESSRKRGKLEYKKQVMKQDESANRGKKESTKIVLKVDRDGQRGVSKLLDASFCQSVR